MTGLRFASAELVGMAILADVGAPVVTSTSASLTPPLVRIRRVPGEPRTHFDDPAHLEYMVFGSAFLAAQRLAEAVWQRLEFSWAKGYQLEDGLWVTVDHSASILAPTEVPWPSPDVRVFQGTHLIVTRAIPA